MKKDKSLYLRMYCKRNKIPYAFYWTDDSMVSDIQDVILSRK
jgi:hypothetical protein